MNVDYSTNINSIKMYYMDFEKRRDLLKWSDFVFLFSANIRIPDGDFEGKYKGVVSTGSLIARDDTTSRFEIRVIFHVCSESYSTLGLMNMEHTNMYMKPLIYRWKKKRSEPLTKNVIVRILYISFYLFINI